MFVLKCFKLYYPNGSFVVFKINYFRIEMSLKNLMASSKGHSNSQLLRKLWTEMKKNQFCFLSK